MGVLTKGTTYAAGGTVAAADLEDLMTSATLAGVSRSHIRTSGSNGGSVATRGSSDPPGPYTGEVKIEPDKHEALAVYDGSEFVPGQPNIIKCQVWAPETGGVAQFDALAVIGMNGAIPIVRLTRQATNPNSFFGIALETAAAGASLFVHVSGEVTKVNVASAVSAGDPLQASSTNGKLETSADTDGALSVFCLAREAAVAAGSIKAWIIR